MATPTRPVVFSGYEPAQIAKMTDILRRASPNRVVDQAALEIDLLDAIHVTGIGREDSDAAARWHERSEDSHLDLARQFMEMAEAPNPLDPSVCTTALSPELNGMIHNRWTARWRKEQRGDHASMRNIDWESLSAREQIEIRQMARTLSVFHKTLAPANRPRKDDIDTVLLLLAEIFADHIGYSPHPQELPHSEGSRFILFAGEALKPFFHPSEISVIALARRWKRMKKEYLAARP